MSPNDHENFELKKKIDEFTKNIFEINKMVQEMAQKLLEIRYGAGKISNAKFSYMSPNPQPTAPSTWKIEGTLELKKLFGKKLLRFRVLVDLSTRKGTVNKI